MSIQEFRPWWERVNDYYIFHEKDEFVRGATSYRPNNRQEAMVAQLLTGYVSDRTPQIPKPIGKTGERNS